MLAPPGLRYYRTASTELRVLRAGARGGGGDRASCDGTVNVDRGTITFAT